MRQPSRILSLILPMVLLSVVAGAQDTPPLHVIVAGDIASCETDGDEQTHALVETLDDAHTIDYVITPGDHVYPWGTPAAYADCYTPTWGQYRERTFPAIGNHDRPTRATLDYFDLQGRELDNATLDLTLADYGTYIVDIGPWLFVFLNIDLPVEQRPTQRDWLAASLAETTADCIAAVWHQPLFSSGEHSGYAPVREFWLPLADANTDLILNGHDHHYERFAPQTAQGAPAPTGPRQFIVGTGGYVLYPPGTPAPNSAFTRFGELGVLHLTLYPDRYTWSYITTTGGSVDEGEAPCHA